MIDHLLQIRVLQIRVLQIHVLQIQSVFYKSNPVCVLQYAEKKSFSSMRKDSSDYLTDFDRPFVNQGFLRACLLAFILFTGKQSFLIPILKIR